MVDSEDEPTTEKGAARASCVCGAHVHERQTENTDGKASKEKTRAAPQVGERRKYPQRARAKEKNVTFSLAFFSSLFLFLFLSLSLSLCLEYALIALALRFNLVSAHPSSLLFASLCLCSAPLTRHFCLTLSSSSNLSRYNPQGDYSVPPLLLDSLSFLKTSYFMLFYEAPQQ
jgi:hypothetical protein